jgi:predicted methyltransferase
LNYRVKLLIFLLCALAALLVLDVGYAALNTISRLNTVEAERDQWQRPKDVLQALDLRTGHVVVDLGCGSGYFTLKLSSSVGEGGRVIAEDIRRLPLIFLWLRTLSRREHNVEIVLGEPANPRLPRQVNAVLILNTFHEITDKEDILAHVFESLLAGGRLVVVDRSPQPVRVGAAGLLGHEVSAEQVEGDLREAHFEITGRQDKFIDKDPDNESWWLIVASKP